MKIINDAGVERLIDAVYKVAVSDILKRWSWQKQGKDKNFESESQRKSWDSIDMNYSTAVVFLKSDTKGQRILRFLNKLTDEDKEDLFKNIKKEDKIV